MGKAVVRGNPAELVGNAGGVDEASTVKHSGNKNNSQGKFSVTSLSAVNQFSKGTSETLSKRVQD